MAMLRRPKVRRFELERWFVDTGRKIYLRIRQVVETKEQPGNSGWQQFHGR
jgi:hypothetical protein